ncbi:dihydropteroate synthase [Neptunomonas japonica]|uniref:Dihydropteroate synthase n=1 Tax=Neptunomonas japonica JAMM 1380 TaxID=1441457 RepID=A0A7R6SY67_9GAMM|nr:dihydropteroate synthase [Neptunomonas japonica]BBB31560.1 dihydropteroate synthase [Neptunomonas japonica JAMM 1380]
MTILQCGLRALDLQYAHVMGILNVTPDSFSDGGALFKHNKLSLDSALQRAAQMVKEGASIIDIGGESTRPGAKKVTLQEELDRVLPIVDIISKELDVMISVDTSQPEVIINAAQLGAGMINDVRALSVPGALEAAAEIGLPICLMHMKGSPQDMQDAPIYTNVIDEVAAFFNERIKACTDAGISAQRLLLDPGFGFGKTLEHNLALLNRLDALHDFALPLLIGTSRKSMIAGVLDREVDQRLSGSLATVAIGVMKGAKIIRVHDVLESVDVVRMTEAVMYERGE